MVKVTVQKIRDKKRYDDEPELVPEPILFGFGLLPDGRRIAIESYGNVDVGKRYEAEKDIAQNKYIIGKKKKKE